MLAFLEPVVLLGRMVENSFFKTHKTFSFRLLVIAPMLVVLAPVISRLFISENQLVKTHEISSTSSFHLRFCAPRT